MPTSDNTPADDQRIDRLYRASQSTSPIDLDDSIRAAARAAQTSTQSGYWNWQQRFGWATAAAVVLTSVLFITLPETAPQEPLNAQSERPLDAEAPAVQSAPSSADSPPQRSRVVADKTQSLAIEADARHPIAVFSKNAREGNTTKMESLSQRKSAIRLEEAVVSGSVAAPQCQSRSNSLIERICSVPGNPNHFIAYPKQTALCGPLTLDKLRSPPLADAASNADTFVYSVGKDTFSATCERGDWVIQSLARGR